MGFRKDTLKEHQLDAFCDLATHAVATRMLEEIKTTGRTHWTGQVTITNSGLEIADRKGHVEEIPFAAICEHSTSHGVFELRRAGRRVMKSNVDASNFLPGLCLVQWLSDEVKAGQTVADVSSVRSTSRATVEQQPPIADGHALLANDEL